ncbi:MAG: methylmalonyl-CoA mutase, partial [Euryarchaeota archaeon]|nr:methylmalonyl-CoA mutase [Euryarchaeota archaeon]
RKERDDEAVEDALSGLQDAAGGEENVMPYILSAVKAEATTGEICDVLRERFGEYHPGTAL